MTQNPCYLFTWLKKEPEILLLNMERAQLERVLAPIMGDYLIQIGGLSELTESSPIPNKAYFNVKAKSGSIRVALDELPLLPQSIDVIVLVHTLEFTATPVVLLQEIHQALAPGGVLVIVSLNPWSLWGLKHFFSKKNNLPWRGRYWSIWHVEHWLRVIGLQIVSSDTFCFRPPLASIQLWQRLLWLEALGSFCFPALGGFFLLMAQKRNMGMTKIPILGWTKKMVNNASLEPTTRVSSK